MFNPKVPRFLWLGVFTFYFNHSFTTVPQDPDMYNQNK